MRELKGKNIALIAEANQLHETIRELKEAKERLEAMASAQRDFITVVSHQFRTPLAAIRWQSDMLLETTSGKPELHDIAAMAELIHERSVFLIDVLENIFDLLAIEAGEFQLSRSPTKLSVLVEKACGEREKDAERKHLTLMRRINADDELLLDPNVIHRVLTVLLVNAINYSNDGGTVEISVDRRSGGERGSEMIVSVRDEGIGIRPEDRPRIFEKFFRAKNAVATVPDGAGIALYLAKRMVELHGGKIWVESPGMGGGSTFFFTIPLNDAMETQETASTTPNAPS
jgi:signal transduction histidine kinase